MSARKTPFYDKHLEKAGKIVEFAGFLMPVSFTGINKEHLHVRTKVGVFDVSHMGEFFVEGEKAEDYLQKMTINNVKALVDNQAQYSAICYENGLLIDDLIVYKFHSEKYMLVVNASNLEKDYQWLENHLPDGVGLSNQSQDYGLLAVQGPDSFKTMEKLTQIALDKIGFYHFRSCKLAGKDVVLSRTGYTGEPGFEIYHKTSDSKVIWDAVFEAGEEFDIQPIGLGARDTLRMEMKYCLYGNDIDETTNPLEAGLGWICKLKAGGDFIGSKALKKIKQEKVSRKLVGFIMKERGIPRHNYKVFSESDEIGYVTSGTQSPSLNQAIGLAYVKPNYAAIGTDIFIEIRNKMIPAKVVKTPFVESQPY